MADADLSKDRRRWRDRRKLSQGAYDTRSDRVCDDRLFFGLGG
jgi:hypothetical protein